MLRDRLELSFQRMKHGDWKRFEEFASEALSGEYPGLRTIASPSGDEGVDATLFSPGSDPSVVLQYSVQETWAAKIRGTAKRILETTPAASLLIYATSKQVGSDADELRKELREKYRLHLDIRDASWFLDRTSIPSIASAADRLAQIYVDPLLPSASKGIRKAVALDNSELAAAHMFLALQWIDQERDRGLTKSCFEALILSALRGSSPASLVEKAKIVEAVSRALPNYEQQSLISQIDSALGRMTKTAIKLHPNSHYCLSDAQKRRIDEFELEQSIQSARALDELEAIAATSIPTEVQDKIAAADVAHRAYRIIQKYMYARGEAFASAVIGNRGTTESVDLLEKLIHEDQADQPPARAVAAHYPRVLKETSRAILSNPSQEIHKFIRTQADAYTLSAFLVTAPDVQRATRKMFSHGEIWLDASIFLFLAAESLFEQVGPVTRVVQAAKDSGVELVTSDGFVEEVERHMNRCVAYSRSTLIGWEAEVPLLARKFIESGRPRGAIPDWLETYRGERRPVDDVREWIQEDLKIRVHSIDEDAARVDVDLRNAVVGIWQEAHEKRREKNGQETDTMTIARLARHDADCYLGVISRRAKQHEGGLGYTSWWLTLDRVAVSLAHQLASQRGIKEDSPVMSLDFLSNYVAFGPNRAAISKDSELMLPLLIEPSMVRYLTPQLIEEADRVRTESADVPERLQRRKVRDYLDRARRQQGELSTKLGGETA